MKFLLLVFMLFSSSKILAGELDSISLVSVVPYERPTSSTQTFTSKFKVGIGDLIHVDISQEVKNKVAPYAMDLAPYFKKPGELDAFVTHLVDVGRTQIIGSHLSDEKLIKFYGYLGNQLVGEIFDRILVKEGVHDQERRELWVKKVMTPFNACISRSQNSQYDASHCMDALTSSLVANAGVGLVYELTRANLNKSLPENKRAEFDLEQVNNFKNCANKTEIKPQVVKTCALTAMRMGVLKITNLKLSKSITSSASSPAAAKAIKQAVWGPYQACSQKVGSDSNSDITLSDQFKECIDDLIKNTGMQLVQDKILNTKAISANFPKAEVIALAKDKMNDFKECFENAKKYNVRKDGMIDTDKCENQITNQITYQVVTKTLQSTSAETFKQDSSLVNNFANEGKKILDKCWSDNQSAPEREKCLRTTVKQFTLNIANFKLNQSIPSDLSIKQNLMETSLKKLDGCLEDQLPSNISTAPDLTALVKKCTNELTRSSARAVASESIRVKARESNLPPDQVEALVKKNVDQNFMSCIGNPPTDALIESCSSSLKKDTAIALASSLIRTNASGKMSEPEVNQLVNQLVSQEFTTCLGNKPNDNAINTCVASLTQKATRNIVLAYEKKQFKEQLNANFTPKELVETESNFIACTQKSIPPENVSKEMDECTKQFSMNFAKKLGALKLNNLLKSVLGSEEFLAQKPTIDDILNKYNECIDSLKPLSMKDQLLEKLTTCTEGLQRRGVSFVSATVNHWMSNQDKDAATLMVKNEFARFLPCIGGLLPSAPYNPNMQQNVDSILKPVSLLIAQYIEYDPENAKQNLDEIIKKLTTDLKDVATNPESKKALIDSLYQNGALDQFLKSMVRGQVKDSISKMKEDELPKEVRDIILEKETFDKMFASPEGQAIKGLVMDKILKPVLLEQADMKSPLMVEGMGVIKDRVVKLMVNSPHFGERIVKSSIQNKIDKMNVFKKFFAKLIYGNNAFNWELVRTTPDGIAAEEFIREKILMPKFTGQQLPREEEKRINEQAESLVTTAVKNYK